MTTTTWLQGLTTLCLTGLFSRDLSRLERVPQDFFTDQTIFNQHQSNEVKHCDFQCWRFSVECWKKSQRYNIHYFWFLISQDNYTAAARGRYAKYPPQGNLLHRWSKVLTCQSTDTRHIFSLFPLPNWPVLNMLCTVFFVMLTDVQCSWSFST